MDSRHEEAARSGNRRGSKAIPTFQQPDHSTPARSQLLDKYRFLVAIGREAPRLSRGALAVLTAITDHANGDGIAWPSLTTLARECGIDRSTVCRIVRDLKSGGYLHVAQAGSRSRSTRYRVALEMADKVGAATHLEVGAAVHQGRCETVTHVGAATPPESIHESGHEARDEMNGCNVPESDQRSALDAPPCSDQATGGGGAVDTFADRYPEFWRVYPIRAEVARVEAMIADLIERGASLAAILAGAERYGAYVETNPKMRMAASKWLEGQRWRDEWTPAKRQRSDTGEAKPERAGARAKPSGKGKAAVKGENAPASRTARETGKTTPAPAPSAQTGSSIPAEIVEAIQRHARGEPLTDEARARLNRLSVEQLDRWHSEALRIHPRPDWLFDLVEFEEERRIETSQEPGAAVERQCRRERAQTFAPWENRAEVKALVERFMVANRPKPVTATARRQRSAAQQCLIARLTKGHGQARSVSDPLSDEYRASLREFFDWHQAQQQAQ